MTTETAASPSRTVAAHFLSRCMCCGYTTIGHPAWTFAGGGDRCPVCGWVSDFLQEHDLQVTRAANPVSLNAARENYRAYGAADLSLRHVVRPPRPDEEWEERPAREQPA